MSIGSLRSSTRAKTGCVLPDQSDASDQTSEIEPQPWQAYRVLSLDLVGLDNAWRAAIEPNNESVAMQAIDFLNKLHKSVSTPSVQASWCFLLLTLWFSIQQTYPDLLTKLDELRERHVATCMGFITEAFAKVDRLNVFPIPLIPI